MADEEDLDVLFTILFAAAPVFAVVGAALFVWRRRVFPLRGRVASFVVMWEFVLLRAAMEAMIRAMSDHDAEFPCWATLIQVHTEFFAQNAMIARIFRLWYLIYAGRERQAEVARLRERRSRNPSRLLTNGKPGGAGGSDAGAASIYGYVSPEATEMGPMAVSLEMQGCTTADCTSKHSKAGEGCTSASKVKGSGDSSAAAAASAVRIASSPKTAAGGPTPIIVVKELYPGNKTQGPPSAAKPFPNLSLSPSKSQPYASASSAEIKARGWFLRRPYLGRTSFLGKVVVVVSLVDILAVELISVISDPTAGYCGGAEHVQYFLLAQTYLGILLTIWFGWKIRNVRDGFFIKDEFKVLGASAIGGAILLPFDVSNVSPETTPLRAVLTWLLIMTSIYALTFYPVLKSFGYSFPSSCRRRVRRWRSSHKAKRRRKSHSKSASRDPSLRQVLTDESFKEARLSFESQMAREFAIENLQFYEASSEFFALSRFGENLEEGAPHQENVPEPSFVDISLAPLSNEQVAVRALEIFREFIADSAPSEINIPFTMKREICDRLQRHISNFSVLAAYQLKKQTLVLDESIPQLSSEEPRLPSTTFEAARKMIFHLMENDPYQRFLARRRRSISQSQSRSKLVGFGGT